MTFFIYFRLFDETGFFFDCTFSIMVLLWGCDLTGFFFIGKHLIGLSTNQLKKKIMAKVLFTALMADFRGKLNGTVGARNRGGNYLRTKVTPLNPKTEAQVQARSRLANFSQAWRTLTEEQRNSWNSAVDQFARTNVFGNLVNPSGSALFTRINVNIALAGGTTITVPPSPSGVASLQTLIASAAEGDDEMNIAFTASPSPAGTVMYVEATPMMSAGITNANSKFRHIATLPAATVSGVDIAAQYKAKFGSLVAGQKFFVRVKMIAIATGEVSQVLSSGAIVIA